MKNEKKKNLQDDLPQCHTSTHGNIPAFPPKIMHKCGPMQNNPMLSNKTMNETTESRNIIMKMIIKSMTERKTEAPFGLESSLKWDMLSIWLLLLP